MARIVSFVVLVVILLGIGILFFQVIANFLLPMFIALVLVVIFSPLHELVRCRCRGHDRLAALLTTIAILLTVLAPMGVVFARAGVEAIAVYRDRNGADTEAGEEGDFVQTTAEKIAVAAHRMGVPLAAGDVRDVIAQHVEKWVAPVVRTTAQLAAGVLIGAAVTIISLYYFLADGPAFLRNVQQLLPLDPEYQDVLITRFQTICRAVVSAMLLSALAQGMMAGLGYYLAGVQLAFLLSLLTMVLAMIPFVGATAVWLPVCLWLFFHEERYVAAIVLALYGVGVVSTIDNVVRPIVLHGQSNLHPLLALLSVLGGIQALGVLGIIVGPMVVAFLHALLQMFRTELARMSTNQSLSRPIFSG